MGTGRTPSLTDTNIFKLHSAFLWTSWAPEIADKLLGLHKQDLHALMPRYNYHSNGCLPYYCWTFSDLLKNVKIIPSLTLIPNSLRFVLKNIWKSINDIYWTIFEFLRYFTGCSTINLKNWVEKHPNHDSVRMEISDKILLVSNTSITDLEHVLFSAAAVCFVGSGQYSRSQNPHSHTICTVHDIRNVVWRHSTFIQKSVLWEYLLY